MLKHILKIIIVFEVAGLCYYLFKIAALIFAEYNSTKSYNEIHQASYEKTIKSERVVNILKNLNETPYEG